MIIENINVNKLHEEFIKEGIEPYPVLDLGGSKGDFIFPDGTDVDLVQQIIDRHDNAPSPKPPTEKERLEALEQALLEMVMGGM